VWRMQGAKRRKKGYDYGIRKDLEILKRRERREGGYNGGKD